MLKTWSGPKGIVITLDGRASLSDLDDPATVEKLKNVSRFRIDLRTSCNARCVFCGSGRVGTLKDLDFDLYCRSVELALSSPHLMRIQFGCAFEPTLHPDLDRYSEVVASHELPPSVREVSLVTNGWLLHRFSLKPLVAAGLNKLHLSCHAHTPDVYRDVMGGGDLERTVRNVEDFRTRFPQIPIWMACVVTSKNADNLAGYVRWAMKLGVNYLLVRRATIYSDTHEETSGYKAFQKYGDSLRVSDEHWADIVREVKALDGEYRITTKEVAMRQGTWATDEIQIADLNDPKPGRIPRPHSLREQFSNQLTHLTEEPAGLAQASETMT